MIFPWVGKAALAFISEVDFFTAGHTSNAHGKVVEELCTAGHASNAHGKVVREVALVT